MYNLVKTRTPILAMISLMLAVSNAFADNKVVVIPLGADSVAPGSEMIRSGTTVTGVAGWDHAVVSDNQDVRFNVFFPGRAPQVLTPENVNFSNTSASVADGDIACTGTFAAPTAPAGKVCIYIGEGANYDGASGFAIFPSTFADTGFTIVFNTNSTNVGIDMYMSATWAYTAP